MILENPEEAIQPDVDARRLHHLGVEWLQLDALLLDLGKDVAIGKKHDRNLPQHGQLLDSKTLLNRETWLANVLTWFADQSSSSLPIHWWRFLRALASLRLPDDVSVSNVARASCLSAERFKRPSSSSFAHDLLTGPLSTSSTATRSAIRTGASSSTWFSSAYCAGSRSGWTSSASVRCSPRN